jgi:hypothetical protein
MMRAWLGCLIAYGSCAAAFAEECPWLDGKEPPTLEVRDGRVSFRAKYHPAWFRCAKKAGGTLVVRVFTGSGGKLKLLRARPARSYSVWADVGHRDLCGQDPPENQARIELEGTGAMGRLSYKSDLAEVFCPRCTWRRSEATFALIPKRRGGATLRARLPSEWHSCAREAGGTLTLLFFTGETREEVRSAVEPTFVIRGLERSHKIKKKISRRRLCRGSPAYLAYEFRGTGEMQVAAKSFGRGVTQLRCP